MAETAGPHLADICLEESKWPVLLRTMADFGTIHHLELHGGIEKNGPNGRHMLNAYLAQGYNFYFGDDLDLWFVSDPFRPRVIALGVILKRKPITPEQMALANGLIVQLHDFSSAASGPETDRHC
ncbi:MAG: hypothetical protein ACR2F8_12715 [Caulobacteraceae bacterium]